MWRGDPTRLSTEPSYRNRRVRSALVALALSACSCMLLDALIYLPSRGADSPPAGVEERAIVTADGVRLHAFFAPPPTSDAPVLVWSHGNAGNVSMRADVLVLLARKGLGVLAYDYRGYGASAGRPNEQGLSLDAEAAYDSLRSAGVASGRIVCFGESLGGAVSIELARRRPCAALILVSTFTTLNEVARHHYGALTALLTQRFPSLSRIKDVRVPLLALHGDEDEVVPYELGERLFAAANEPKRFLRIRGAMHNDVFDHPEVIDAIADFAISASRRGTG